MKTIKWVSICIILASTLIIGCNKKKSESESVISTSKQVSNLDFSKISTSAHVTYIPLNLAGYPSDNKETIIKVVEEFQKKYPSLNIKSEQIEFQPFDHSTQAQTYGIWIFHDPMVVSK